MKHNMRLYQDPFERMINGSKKVEFRLLDEKRSKIKIGDTIEFTKLPEEKEKLNVEVLDLVIEDDFEKVLNKVYEDKDLINKTLNNINKIYSKEEQEKYKALGIKIKVIK